MNFLFLSESFKIIMRNDINDVFYYLPFGNEEKP